VAQVIADDLTRTGLFEPVPFVDLPSRPSTPDEINFRDWRLLQTPNLVVGSLRRIAANRIAIEFRLYNVFRAEQLSGFQLEVPESELRRSGHQIADIIYERLTGQKGAFDTMVAYVTEQRRAGKERLYALEVADSDGANARTILESREPVLSPSWSPDGRQLAYVSFEGRRPRIFVQELLTGRREVLAAFPGMNSAPAFSPDGTRVAMVLSKDGNAEIYVHYLQGNRLQRLTTNAAIDTEPNWSPDSSHIAFTSDRGGKPQIYRVPSSGGRAERITFDGVYNARPAYSPDGSKLAMVHSGGKGFQIGVLDLENRAFQVLTETQLDESPTFAPNGSMILYATVDRGSAILAAVATDGRMRQRLGAQEGKVREPAWSPFRIR
jgi:TolB protein